MRAGKPGARKKYREGALVKRVPLHTIQGCIACRALHSEHLTDQDAVLSCPCSPDLPQADSGPALCRSGHVNVQSILDVRRDASGSEPNHSEQVG
jgi:hypothetical protein